MEVVGGGGPGGRARAQRDGVRSGDESAARVGGLEGLRVASWWADSGLAINGHSNNVGKKYRI